jgi:hypothetical protein
MHVIKDSTREANVELCTAVSKKGNEIAEDETRTFKPKDFFDDQAFQVGSLIRLDGNDGRREISRW